MQFLNGKKMSQYRTNEYYDFLQVPLTSKKGLSLIKSSKKSNNNEKKKNLDIPFLFFNDATDF